MMFSWKHTKTLITTVVLVAFSLSISWLWLKSPWNAKAPVSVASEFLHLLYQREYLRAHELTLKNGYVGRTVMELERVAAHQLCGGANKFMYTWPRQSNGNRLRRWLRGTDPNMSRVWVEIDGPACLMSVEVRPAEDGQWRVFKFQSHAG